MPAQNLLVVDTDVSLGTPGAEIDDGAALLVLAGRYTGSVQAVTTTFGNVHTELAVQNTHRILAYLDRTDWPVFPGASLPLIQDSGWLADWYSRYGTTPEWPTPAAKRHAVTAIIERVRASPGEITLLALGPLTNLALAVRIAPDIAPLVREVVAMGGSFAHRETPEFNFRCDPEAAHIVMTAPWPVRLLGLDITSQVIFSRHDLESLASSTEAHRLLKHQAARWIDTVEEQGWAAGGCALHDALAVAAVCDNSLFEFVGASVEVELNQPHQRGLTRVRRSPGLAARVQVAAQVEEERCRRWILNALAGIEP